ncbi:MAG TPA: patatin-like phospholipase family protein [Xanthomonadaceae bacterium]|nr:patatin-like phospholipase family protein [Xanthomonadaceae bacterium]
MTKPRDVALDSLQTAADAQQPAAGRARAGTALCLSGGGYRAALFHLGAFLRLHELGVLPQVKLFSAVSGGSIAAAWLLTRFLRAGGDDFATWCANADLRAEVVESFRAVAARDLRTWPVLLTLPFDWAFPGPRVRLLERGYRRVFGDIPIRTLPKHPQFVFCATDLTFGVNWVYSRERVGDYLAGYLHEPRATLARAVAASSSFPPVLGPVRVRAKAADFRRKGYRGPDADTLRGRIQLSDGGVYDNLAMEPALRRYARVLVSDAGAPFAFKAGNSWLFRLRRYTEVVTNQARSLRKRLFFGQRAHGDYDGAYWGLNGAPVPAGGYPQELIESVIGRCRTDLDAFSDAEFAILVNHGYWMCTDAMRFRLDADAPTAWPYPDYRDAAIVRRAMRNSHRRFLRWL